MTNHIIPILPNRVPSKVGRFSRWLGIKIVSALGWKVVGEFPNEPKMMVALGPHTSNWDFLVVVPAIMAIGIDVHYLMKKEAFIWPFSKFFIWLGGVPLDRKSTENTADQLAEQFRNTDALWVAIAPEGTRKKVDYWKTGFLRIAEKAEVPVMLICWDYPSKTMILDKIWPTTGDHQQDAKDIRQYVRTTYQGRHPSNQ